MTDYQLWSLVIGAFTALGTVGAVALSLWYNRPNKPRFKVLGVDSRVNMSVDKLGGKPTNEHFALIHIENLRDVQMQVFRAFINQGGKGSGNEFSKNFIPALSVYPVKLDLNMYLLEPFEGSPRMTCNIVTSFGEVTYKLSEDEVKLFKNHLDHIKELEEKKI